MIYCFCLITNLLGWLKICDRSFLHLRIHVIVHANNPVDYYKSNGNKRVDHMGHSNRHGQLLLGLFACFQALPGIILLCAELIIFLPFVENLQCIPLLSLVNWDQLPVVHESEQRFYISYLLHYILLLHIEHFVIVHLNSLSMMIDTL